MIDLDWIDAQIRTVAPGEAAEQTVSWPVERWRENLHRQFRRLNLGPNALDALLEDLADGPLDRSRLYGMAHDLRLAPLWVATLIWGTGDRLWAWPRAIAHGWSVVLRGEREDDLLEKVARNAATGADEVWGCWLPAMRMAMGSKFWHFSGFRRAPEGAKPVIYDQNTWKASQHAGLDFPSPARMDRDSYARWCRWCEDNTVGARDAADVEYAMFRAGRGL